MPLTQRNEAANLAYVEQIKKIEIYTEENK